MAKHRFDVAIAGNGLFPAICAIHFARLLGPERIVAATREQEFGGNCPELIVADLVNPRAMELIGDYIVMEWDRFAVVGPDGISLHERRLCLLDPVQVYADFVETCTDMLVLYSVKTMKLMDGYLLADGSIYPCDAHVRIPESRLGSRQESILQADVASGLEYPVLLDHSGERLTQIIPIGSGKTLINTIAGDVVTDDRGDLDVLATFPLHSALNSLFS